MLQFAVPDAAQAVERWRALAMVNFAKDMLPSEMECRMVLDKLVQGPQPAGALVQNLAAERQAPVFRTLVWLMKMGVLKMYS